MIPTDSKTAVRSLFGLTSVRWAAIFPALVAVVLGCNGGSKNKKVKGTDKTKKSVPELVAGKIDGDSMAPTLKGVHKIAQCSRCNYEYSFGNATSQPPEKVHCPLCGKSDPLSSVAKDRPANKVQIRKLLPDINIQRWDVIAYEQEGQSSVKRVVGLPFESITFKHGDVFANGVIYPKPPHVQLQTRILMLDSNYLLPGQIKFQTSPATDDFPLSLKDKELAIDFGRFNNFKSVGVENDGLIKDYYGYNQSLSRELHECNDFGIELNFEDLAPTKKGEFKIRAILKTRVYGTVVFEVDVNEQIMMPFIFQNGNRILGGKNIYSETELRIYFSVIDGRARILFGKNKDKSVVLDKLTVRNKKVLPQIRFENLSAGDGKLTRIRIYRDIYYFEKISSAKKASEKNQFFVLGDNVPVSKDSRQGGFRPNRSQIIGVLQQ